MLIKNNKNFKPQILYFNFLVLTTVTERNPFGYEINYESIQV